MWRLYRDSEDTLMAAWRGSWCCWCSKAINTKLLSPKAHRTSTRDISFWCIYIIRILHLNSATVHNVFKISAKSRHRAREAWSIWQNVRTVQYLPWTVSRERRSPPLCARRGQTGEMTGCPVQSLPSLFSLSLHPSGIFMKFLHSVIIRHFNSHFSKEWM